MSRASAWLIAGAAVLATTGVAHAQESTVAPAPSTAEAAQSAVPWYQRFTTSNGVTESITGLSENDRLLAPAWTLNQRWGVTVDVREAQRIERLPDGRGDQTSVGAFYQFTPNVRVGGELNVETAPAPGAVARPEQEEPRADVRIESAFRF
ncbi:MAG: NtrZ family periplasmic regulatory protein [Caulobacteraceae bacterium]